MQEITIRLFGVFRQYQPDARLVLQLAPGAALADVRAALAAYAQAQWPGFPLALLARSALASETRLLNDTDPLPADGQLAILPPVAGG